MSLAVAMAFIGIFKEIRIFCVKHFSMEKFEESEMAVFDECI
jgi:hypothetical protein